MRKKLLLVTSTLLNCLLAILLLIISSHYGLFGKVVDRLLGKEHVEVFSPYYLTKTDLFQNSNNHDVDVVFLGDSITDINDWNNAFPETKVVNMGINGDGTNGVLNRLDSVIALSPKKVFIMIGINDINSGRSNTSITKNYEGIVSKLKEGSPDTEVYIQSVLPINQELINYYYGMSTDNDVIMDLNERIEGLSEELGVVYLDLYHYFLDSNGELDSDFTIDGIHLDHGGYVIWEGIIEKYTLN